jgi:hypothetical protein
VLPKGPVLSTDDRDAARVRRRLLVAALCAGVVLIGALLADSGRAAAPGPAEPSAAAPSAAPQSHVAVADAFVSARSPKRNFGRVKTLRTGGPSRTRSFLRFRLARPLDPAAPARLRLFATVGARPGLTVHLVRGGGRWRERSITAGSAPRLGPAIARQGGVRGARFVSIDVSGALAARRTIDIALVQRGSGRLHFLSRESGRRTAPHLFIGDESQRPPVIAAAGDIACAPTSPNRRDRVPGTCLDRQTSDLLVSRELAAVLALGDTQYERGELSAFRSAYDRTWGRVKHITRPVVGNHEYQTPDAAGYFDYFNGPGRLTGRAGRRGEGWYSFDVGGWHLVALNSICDEVGGCGPGSPQYEWLRADLAAHPAQCTLAYWHHPRFSSGNPGSNVRTDAFWRLLDAAGAELVLAGHSHDYERFAPQTADAVRDDARGIRSFVVGTGGKNNYPFRAVERNSEVRDATSSGVLLLTLRPGGYSWRFAPVSGGRLSDAGFGNCH